MSEKIISLKKSFERLTDEEEVEVMLDYLSDKYSIAEIKERNNIASHQTIYNVRDRVNERIKKGELSLENLKERARRR